MGTKVSRRITSTNVQDGYRDKHRSVYMKKEDVNLFFFFDKPMCGHYLALELRVAFCLRRYCYLQDLINALKNRKDYK